MKVFPLVLRVILILAIIIPTKVIAQDAQATRNPLNREQAPFSLGAIVKFKELAGKAQMKNFTYVKWKPWINRVR